MLAKITVALALVALVPALSLTVSVGASRKTGASREAVVALEKEWLNHISDGPTLDRILADDFIHPVPEGFFLTKQQHIQWAVEHPRPASWSGKFEKLEVRIYGTTAVASGIVAATGVDGKTHRTIFTDVFVLRDGRWKAVNAQENEIGQ